MDTKSIARYLLVLVATFYVINWTFALLNRSNSLLNLAGFLLIASWGLVLLETKFFKSNPLKKHNPDNGSTPS
ncbi:hypothetical protein [Larkinella rosea]|uniref:Uncharacterized protein n=1 Tax=Larkinella rosea TaxID=2025312 RepID=A0A3P1BLX6_9BACT|nr:hypothetical protein [Larkinella rosea]RRB02029.1 hypothetical protein EHT25_16165 [Larkinella rosea]